MEVTGKIIQVFEPVSGTSQSGNTWKKREYLLEVPNGQYPTKIFFNFWGDRADEFILTGGKEYRISFDISSREYNGRWYTDIRAWKAEEINGGSTSSNGGGSNQQNVGTTPPPIYVPNDPFGNAPTVSESDLDGSSSNDDLPF